MFLTTISRRSSVIASSADPQCRLMESYQCTRGAKATGIGESKATQSQLLSDDLD